MNIRSTLLAFFTAILIANLGQLHAETVFSDSFESGDMSATNSVGFRWTSNAWTSLVTPTTEVWLNGKAINKSKENASSFPGKEWAPQSGSHSLRFRYSAGEAMSEQRFDLGAPMKDLWINFWLYVPINFSFGPDGSPNKFFALWSDGYSQNGDGSTVWLGMHRYNGTGSTLAYTYSKGGNTTSSAYQQHTPFLTTDDAGKWMQVIFRVKAETSPNSNDGIIQTYRRWKGEDFFTKIHEDLNAPLKLPSSGPQGFKAAYLLGWANAAYTQDTEWLLDDLKIHDSSPEELVLGKVPKSFTLNVQ